MARRRWVCETCSAHHDSRTDIWLCVGCECETCESCFWVYGHCKPCSQGKTDRELLLAANAAWGEDHFEPEDGEENVTNSPLTAWRSP